MLAPWANSATGPVLYHVTSRVVAGGMALDPDEREHFRALMRKQEQFTGCRVLAYCVMSDHFSLLLEVPPGSGISLDPDSFDRAHFEERLAAIYPAEKVAEIVAGLDVGADDAAEAIRDIAGPYLQRMGDLSQFTKGVLQRFTRWFNSRHERRGTLWEDRFKSVIVENGVPARTLAAYIDLAPVRAGLVDDPANYRWSSFGESSGESDRKTGGKAARAGLVRALAGDDAADADASRWPEVSGKYRRLLQRAIDTKDVDTHEAVEPGDAASHVTDRDFATEMAYAGMLMHPVRHFTDGAVLGGKEFVERFFDQAREHFGPRRTTGARKLRGNAAKAAGVLWTARDLQKGVGLD